MKGLTQTVVFSGLVQKILEFFQTIIGEYMFNGQWYNNENTKNKLTSINTMTNIFLLFMDIREGVLDNI